jgi:hypothetical protein
MKQSEQWVAGLGPTTEAVEVWGHFVLVGCPGDSGEQVKSDSGLGQEGLKVPVNSLDTPVTKRKLEHVTVVCDLRGEFKVQFPVDLANRFQPEVGTGKMITIGPRILAGEPRHFFHFSIWMCFRQFKTDPIKHTHKSGRE